MPDTQAYSVDWDVTVAGQDVDRDVVSLTIEQKEGSPNSATVELDTSQKPYAIEEESTVVILLSGTGSGVGFRGRVDSVEDDKEDPLVTLDAREPEGVLDDVSAVGNISEDTIFDVIGTLMNSSPGQVRGVDFDPSTPKSNYGTFGNTTIFGNFSAYAVPQGLGDPSQEETWTQQETLTGQGKSVEVSFAGSNNYYSNQSSVTYQAELQGKDGEGNDVSMTFDLPPGEDAQDAFGTTQFQLPVVGGNGLVAEITGITTDLPDSVATDEVFSMGGTVRNYVRTDYTFRADSDTTVRDALDLLVGYISTLDGGTDWSYTVTSPTNGTPELQVSPTTSSTSERWVFTEGDNVLRPVANRSLDGVYNMVKVNGANRTNVWAWAYDGTFYYSFNNPFDSGEYPDNPDFNTTYGSTGSVNDIDQIDLRAKGIDAPNATDVFQANDLAETALKQLYRSPVSGVATVTGIHLADPGDEAEVYYPSRGIPAKVVDNVYTVKAVEYTVDSGEATTKIDFGITEPKTGDMIQAASGGSLGGAVRNDVDSAVRNELQSDPNSGVGGGGLVVVGTLDQKNDDGTWTVSGRDGETYENVEVI